MLNGFFFLLILIIFLDKINLLHINDFILLRITNPIHYMTEFTGNLANGTINIDYVLQFIFQLFSNYRFNLVELIIILSLLIINLKNRNYIIIIFSIFLINTLVMNIRYITVYHLFYVFIYLIFFTEAVKKFKHHLSLNFAYLTLIVFFINSLNFLIIKDNYLKEIFYRENGMLKVCNELNFNISSGTYETIDYIKYWHTKFDNDKIKKICDEIT